MSGSLPKMALMMVLIIAVSVIVTTVASVAVFSMMANQNQQPATETAQNLVATNTILEYDTGQVLADLTDKTYVQLNVVLRYPEVKRKIWFGLSEEVDDTIPKALESKTNEINDAIYTLLRNKRSSDLRGEALSRTKLELTAEINKLLPTGAQISDILITNIRVQ